MIKLSNGHVMNYVIASGALAFDGLGWLWERPLVWLGLLKPELFTIVVKSLTLHPREGNLRWWKPWTCVQLIKGGAVNKVGLTNGGIDWWCKKVAPKIDFNKYKIVVSVFGNKEEIVEMIEKLNGFPLVGIEINYSCPNAGQGVGATESAIDAGKAAGKVSKHPLLFKVSYAQNYLKIASELEGIVEAISINTVPYELVFPKGPPSPLWKLEKKVKGGGGGVSGEPAQHFNWKVVRDIAQQGRIPVIAPSVMKFQDMETVRRMGATAISFGTIHMASHPVLLKPWTVFTNPLKPTRYVQREQKTNRREKQ